MSGERKSMFFSKISTKNFSPFVLFSMACSFFIALEYGVSRPTSNAFFVSTFGASFYPYAWIATVPLNFFVISLYNRFLPKIGCQKMMRFMVFLVMSVSFFAYAFIEKYPKLVFFHYLWKDIYILLMFKQLWSLIHSSIDTKKAKYLYGLFFGIGGMGSIVGSFLPGFFAVTLGSKNLFLATIPAYLALLFFYQKALKESTQHLGFQQDFSFSMKSGFSLVWEKRFLMYILFLVVFMQLSVAFVEYQFNFYLEKHIPSLDLRTEYCGNIVSVVNILATSFQLLGGFLLIEMLGLKYAHRMIPLCLCAQGILFQIFPSFSMISLSFISTKSMDHSFFGIVREMLYIPLTKEEKFRAKAVIDVFAYRTAKAVASFFLIFIQGFSSPFTIKWISSISLMIFIFWAFLTVKMFQEDSIWNVEKKSLPKKLPLS